MCHLQEFHSGYKQDESGPFGDVFMAKIECHWLELFFKLWFFAQAYKCETRQGQQWKCRQNLYYSRQRKGPRLTQGPWLITMATVLMAALLPQSAGRHHHTKPREDREVWEDRGWRELSLQTVVCNALWESLLPRTPRQGINQPHAWDQETAVCCHTLPTLPAGDWLACVIYWFEALLCNSCPQSHRGERYDVNFSLRLSVIIICAACRPLYINPY